MDDLSTARAANPACTFSISGISALRLDAIPRDLKSQPQWVSWQSFPRGDGKKPTKVPINPATGGNARSNDSSTWNTFEYAVKRAIDDDLAGIGFMFNGTDLVGVDLDDVRDGDRWTNPLAMSFAYSLDTYTEISPSGRGVKMWLRSATPPSRCNGTISHGKESVDFETYDHGRWFAVTGHVLPQYGEGAVQERTDRYSRMLAMGAKEKINPIRTSNPAAPIVPATGAVVDEESMLRAALRFFDVDSEPSWFRCLCCLKSWGTTVGDDTARALCMEWSKSSPKWDQDEFDRRWDRADPDGGLTIGSIFFEAHDDGYKYGDAEGRDGAAYRVERKTPPKTVPSTEAAKPMEVTRLCDVKPMDPTARWLVTGVIPRSGFSVIVGPEKSLKSMMALDLALAVVGGDQWMGRFPVELHGRVLYLCLDQPTSLLRERAIHLGGGRVLDRIDVVEYCEAMEDGGEAALRSRLAKAKTDGTPYVLVVVDVWTLFGRQNAKSSLNAYERDYQGFSLLQSILSGSGSTCVLLHHLNKEGSVSGSKALESAAEQVLLMDKVYSAGTVEEDPDGKWKLFRRMSGVTKCRWGGIDKVGVDLWAEDLGEANEGRCVMQAADDPEVQFSEGIKGAIFKVLGDNGIVSEDRAIPPSDVRDLVCQLTGREVSQGGVKATLFRMHKDMLVARSPRHGYYLSDWNPDGGRTAKSARRPWRLRGVDGVPKAEHLGGSPPRNLETYPSNYITDNELSWFQQKLQAVSSEPLSETVVPSETRLKPVETHVETFANPLEPRVVNHGFIATGFTGVGVIPPSPTKRETTPADGVTVDAVTTLDDTFLSDDWNLGVGQGSAADATVVAAQGTTKEATTTTPSWNFGDPAYLDDPFAEEP